MQQPKTTKSRELVLGYTRASFLKSFLALALYALVFTIISLPFLFLDAVYGLDEKFLRAIKTNFKVLGHNVEFPMSSNRYLFSAAVFSLLGSISLYAFREIVIKKIKHKETSREKWKRPDASLMMKTSAFLAVVTLGNDINRIVVQSLKDAIDLNQHREKLLIATIFLILLLLNTLSRTVAFIKRVLSFSDANSNDRSLIYVSALIGILPVAFVSAGFTMFVGFYALNKVTLSTNWQQEITVGGKKLLIFHNKNHFLTLFILGFLVMHITSGCLGGELQNYVGARYASQLQIFLSKAKNFSGRGTVSKEITPISKPECQIHWKKLGIKIAIGFPIAIIASFSIVAQISLDQSVIELATSSPDIWLVWFTLSAPLFIVSTVIFSFYQEFMTNVKCVVAIDSIETSRPQPHYNQTIKE